jgi:glycosyltransferase involved in cell wall biosynthesis
MSVYNERPEFLAQAMRSILAQSFADFEIVLIDDGSDRSDTLTALDQWQAADSRVQLYRQSNQGLTRSLNSGLQRGRGEFIARHDSDDWSSPNRFARQIEYLEQHPKAAVVGSWFELHQEDGTPLWVARPPHEPVAVIAAFPKQNPFCHGSILFRAAAAREIGGYRECFACSQDYDFLWRLCERFGGANIPAPLYHHRRTAGSISVRRSREQAYCVALARVLARRRANGAGEDIHAAQFEAASIVRCTDPRIEQLRYADHLLLAGQHHQAIRAAIGAMARWPTWPLAYKKTLRAALYVVAPRLRASLFGH